MLWPQLPTPAFFPLSLFLPSLLLFSLLVLSSFLYPFPFPFLFSFLQASPSSKRRNQTLQPIIEGETAHFCDEIKEEEEEEDEQEESGGMQNEGSEVIIALDPAAQPRSQQPLPDSILRSKMGESSGKLTLDLRLSSSNASSM